MIQITKPSQNIDIGLPRPILSLLKESRRKSAFFKGDAHQVLMGGNHRPEADAGKIRVLVGFQNFVV
jgi:hypothetical protein